MHNEKAWLQATLPVRHGGLGVSRATQLAPSAYLSSTAATADLVSAILPTSHKTLPTPFADAALEKWSVGHNATPPTGAGAAIEKCWVESKVIRVAEALQDGASDEVERARLLAARDKDSGAWLQALPITSVGLRMDDGTLRTAVGLRLGVLLSVPLTTANFVEPKCLNLVLMV